MTKLDWLYFEDTTENIVYTRNPADKFVIDRIFNGEEACWQKEATCPQKRKKTLLVCDKTATHWSIEKQSDVKANLKKLLQEDFSIFVWQKDKPISISINDLYLFDNLDFRKKISPLHPQLMQLAMSAQQILPRMLLFLNYFNINRLLGKENFTKIDTYDFLPYYTENPATFNVKLEEFIECLTQEAINPAGIVHSFYFHDEKTILKKIKKCFPNLSISYEINHFDLNFYRFLYKPEEFNTYTVKSISCRHSTPFFNWETQNILEKSSWPSLEIYDIYQLQNDYSLKILQAAVQLKKLKIHSMNNLLNEQWFIDNPDALSNLEEIDIGIDSASAPFPWNKFLSSLSKRASTLKSIRIGVNNISFQDDSFDGFNFNTLEALTLEGKSIPFKFVMSILKEATNLQKLYLKVNALLFDTSSEQFSSPVFANLKELTFANLEELNLAKLKELILDRNTRNKLSIPAQMLFTILNNAPRLVKLNITGCNIIGNTSISPHLFYGLRKVKLLEIGDTQNIARYLPFIFSKTTQLKTLTLREIDSLTSNVNFSKCFEKLEAFTLCGSIPQHLLSNILTQVPHIKSLELKNYNSQGFNPLTKHCDFKSLEVLKIQSATFPLDFLYQILPTALSLKTLVLVGHPIFNLYGNMHVFRNIELKELEYFEYSNKNIASRLISENLFYSFLKKTPNLKQLRLCDCEIQRSSFPLETLCLEKLETVIIKYCTFNTNTLSSILNNASDLKSLDVTRCNISNLNAFNFSGVEFRKLRHLNLGNNVAFPIEGWLPIIEKAKKIQHLQLDEIKELSQHLSSKWFDSHPEHFQHLKTLTIDLESVSSEFFRTLHEHAKLDSLYVWFLNTRRQETYNTTRWFNEKFGKIVVWDYKGSSTDYDEYDENEEHKWKCDANTEHEETEFNIDRIFYAKNGFHPQPSQYRLAVFNAIKIKEEVLKEDKYPFLFYNSEDIKLIDCTVSWEKSKDDLLKKWNPSLQEVPQYYGVYECKLSNKWQALPSLSPQEEIVNLYSADLETKDIELKYSSRDNLYYIRHQEEGHSSFVTLEFLVNVPPQKNHHALNLSAIERFVNSLDYGTKERAQALTINDGESTGKDYLNAIKTQRQGSCKHRTVVFMSEIAAIIADMLKSNPLIPPPRARAVNNACHAYGEIFWRGEWYQCDFGGYASKMNIFEKFSLSPRSEPLSSLQQNNAVIPFQSISSQSIPSQNIPKKSLNPKFMTWLPSEKMSTAHCVEEWMNELFSPHEGRNILIEVHSEEENEAYRLLIQQYCQTQQRNVHYIDQPSDFICSAKWVRRLDNNHAQRMSGPGGDLSPFRWRLYYEHLRMYSNTKGA